MNEHMTSQNQSQPPEFVDVKIRIVGDTPLIMNSQLGNQLVRNLVQIDTFKN